MPRTTKAQVNANYQAIEATASRLFRERGLDAVTIAEVMAGAGLTHGGFYTHFSSKNALAAAACASAFAKAADKWRGHVEAAPSGTSARERIATGYLSPENCNPAVAACPTATLVSDVARAEPAHPIRRSYAKGVSQQIETLAVLMKSGDPSRDRAKACVQLATMMGALLLARALHGLPLGAEIAGATRTTLARVSRTR